MEEEQKHTMQAEEYRHLLQMMIPAYNRTGVVLFLRDRNPLKGNVRLLFPEEDTTMPYLRFEPTRLQVKGHIHHTGRAAIEEFKMFS
ncbi:hypothetical protein TNCV_1963271 [Trichonephila clavipes]|nr:hypothetical protein TNCV_1963271 [Trichonephila clavipes]